jgi:hypothetical protein
VDTESLPEAVTITNNTPAALTISAIKIQGSDSIDFTETTDCGYVIEAGATCT